MFQYLIGVLVGLGSGIAIGLYLGQRQKPRHELTAREKKARVITVVLGVILLIAGAIVLIDMVSS